MEWIDPFYLMRGCTLAIFGFWSVRGYWNTFQLIRRLERIAGVAGMPTNMVRTMIFKYALRVTVFDPINLALLLMAMTLWAGLFSARLDLF